MNMSKPLVFVAFSIVFGPSAASDVESCVSKGAKASGESLIQRSLMQDQTLHMEDSEMSAIDQMAEHLQHLAQGVTQRTSASHRLSILQGVGHVVASLSKNTSMNSLNSTEQAILEQVISIIETAMYSSMDVDHANDVNRLITVTVAVTTANANVAARLGETGDIGIMQAETEGWVTAKNNCSATRDFLQQRATSASANLTTHQIAPKPAASTALPTEKTVENLHAFFASSEYCTWFSAQALSFNSKYEDNVTAHAALANKTTDCALIDASLSTEYCDWKVVLTSACSNYGNAYDDFHNTFSDTVREVAAAAAYRNASYTAGESITSSLRYLLGQANFTENVSVRNTTRYYIDMPAIEARGQCDTNPLAHSDYSAITCQEAPTPTMVSAMAWDTQQKVNGVDLTNTWSAFTTDLSSVLLDEDQGTHFPLKRDSFYWFGVKLSAECPSAAAFTVQNRLGRLHHLRTAYSQDGESWTCASDFTDTSGFHAQFADCAGPGDNGQVSEPIRFGEAAKYYAFGIRVQGRPADSDLRGIRMTCGGKTVASTY